ncbi:hypothetical protein HUJ05_001835 [Dendroctonus ponderosae]|nr:hypothetical protein HUJ05_001835 [Dendroctonus ponderosae]
MGLEVQRWRRISAPTDPMLFRRGRFSFRGNVTCFERLDSSSPDARFSMVLVNIASLRNKTDELYLFLEGLGFPQMVAITEH